MTLTTVGSVFLRFKMAEKPETRLGCCACVWSIYGGVAEWLWRSISNHARSTRVGSNPVVSSSNHKPTVNPAVHPSEVGNEYSEVTLR